MNFLSSHFLSIKLATQTPYLIKLIENSATNAHENRNDENFIEKGFLYPFIYVKRIIALNCICSHRHMLFYLLKYFIDFVVDVAHMCY